MKIIPAHPGWDVVSPDIDEYEKVRGLYFEPVIAWCIDFEDYHPGYKGEHPLVYPITAENWSDEEILRKPDGMFIEPASEIFADEREVIKRFQEINDRKRNAKSKRSS